MTSPQPAVTVLMAVHNGAQHLPHTLASILGQTWRDFEFLIIDDGSTDETPGLLQQAAKADTRVRILTNTKGSGLGASLAKALPHARGRLIARMDADDIALPERLAIQVAFMDANPDVILCSCWAERFEHASGLMAPNLDDRQIKATLAFGNPLCHPGAMFRPEALRQANLTYQDLPAVEDYTLWGQLAFHGKFAIIPQVLLRYRVHGNSMSAQKAALCDQLVRGIQARYIHQACGLSVPDVHHAFVLNRRLSARETVLLLAWLMRLALSWPSPAMAMLLPRKLAAYMMNAWLGRRHFHHPTPSNQT